MEIVAYFLDGTSYSCTQKPTDNPALHKLLSLEHKGKIFYSHNVFNKCLVLIFFFNFLWFSAPLHDRLNKGLNLPRCGRNNFERIC